MISSGYAAGAFSNPSAGRVGAKDIVLRDYDD